MVSSVSTLKQLLQWLKMPLFKLRSNTIQTGSIIDSGTFLRDSVIGKYCYIGRNCVINSAEIGNYSCIAAGVQIGGMEHSYQELSISPMLMGEKCLLGVKTTIGHDAWIGANCIIKQGITIGDGAVVGANSFVNKDVEPYAIVFGSPAKFYKYRDCKIYQSELQQSEYWTNKPESAKFLLEKIRFSKTQGSAV